MGTRNSTLVQIGGEYKIAQYCQWDGYPEGQGLGILNFLRSTDINYLKKKINNLKSLSRDEVNSLWVSEGAEPNSESVDIRISDSFREKNPHLHRDCGGYQILELIDEGKVDSVVLDLEFPGNSLWCEWCYVIDFDLGKFEIYQGFNKKPLEDKERFFNTRVDDKSEYKQVKHLISFDLYNLPDEDQFIKAIESLISDDE
jgi:hypothetical protein